ncbi:MAG: CHRD domain-containing protein [Nitrospinae bacterium]|nr:CHRD domain-containing protein [Nitrospinota bacterium]
MKQLTITGLLVAALLLVVHSAPVQAATAQLSGFQEVPAIATAGNGIFRATFTETGINYTLEYTFLEGGTVSAAHIHIGQVGVNGGVVAFLCGGGNKPACPPSGAVTATIVASDILAVPTQGIAAGELGKVKRAIDAGRAYANVHTATYSGGEIRGQIRRP